MLFLKFYHIYIMLFMCTYVYTKVLVCVLYHLMSLSGSDLIPLPVVVHLGYFLPGRVMAILIHGDAQLAEVMLHRQQHFQ